MERRVWDAAVKARIVLEGLKGRSVAELCTEYQISQNQYYAWREQFLEHAGRAFESGPERRREAVLERENRRLKRLIGDLTLELKKSELG